MSITIRWNWAANAMMYFGLLLSHLINESSVKIVAAQKSPSISKSNMKQGRMMEKAKISNTSA